MKTSINKTHLPKRIFQFFVIPFVILTLSACGSDSGDGAGATNNNGPWLGNWFLVNFLGDTDNGVWGNDNTTPRESA